MRFPDVVIAAAPRCGTTALFSWLGAHPNVCTSDAKESRFLLDADSPLLPKRNVHTDGLPGYASLFARCGPDAVALEATPDYLYNHTPAEVLSTLRPMPHVVFVLRRPPGRLYSFYEYARNNMALLPREVTFAEYVRRMRDPGDTMLDGLGTLRQQLSYGRYADYLGPWLNLFPRDRISVVLFERLVVDPREEISRLARRIGVDPAWYEGYQFKRVNESYGVRSQRLQRMRKLAAPYLPGGRVKSAMRHLYERAFTRRARDAPDPALSAELDLFYQDANRSLSELLEIDLSLWR